MSYARASVVYGVDLTHFPFEKLELGEETIDAIESGDVPGFEARYSGNGKRPLWLGIKICNFNECKNFY